MGEKSEERRRDTPRTNRTTFAFPHAPFSPSIKLLKWGEVYHRGLEQIEKTSVKIMQKIGAVFGRFGNGGVIAGWDANRNCGESLYYAPGFL
jgi:hypothetical protein